MTLRMVEPTQKKLWFAAIKPPMYSVAVMPIWVGSAVAYAETKLFNFQIFLTFLGSAILILAWENLSNDVFDSETGVDVNKANSVVNLTGNKPLVFWIANACLASGLTGIASIALVQQDFTVIGLILLCCAIGYVYQGPPFRLSYKGLGEPLCFVAFGPLAFAAAYYSQTRSWSSTNFAASIGVGIATCLILFCSHFNQVRDDAALGKKSPIVRLGTKRAAALLPWICSSVYAFTVLFVMLKVFPIWTLFSLLSFPVARKLCRLIGSQHDQPHTLIYCRLVAVKFHFWSSLLFGLGFLLS